MKTTILIYILMFLHIDIQSADISNPEYDFIRWYMGTYGSQFDGKTYTERKTVFSDRLGQIAIDAIEQYLLKDTIVNPFKSSHERRSSDTLVLNQKEKYQISTVLHGMAGDVWDQEFLPESKILKLRDLKAAPKPDPFFSFSQPIFLRNNRICFFYCSYYCGNLCASAELSVFQNVNGKWQKMFEIERWIS